MIPKYNLPTLPQSLAGALRKHIGVARSEQLTSLEAAAAFLCARQMAGLWGGTELPSLQESISGELVPRARLVSSPSLGNTWTWTRKLAESGELLLVKLFRSRATFLARPLWPSIAELSPPGPPALSNAGELSTAAKQIASFLLQHGPANTLELQQALLRQFPILPASLKKGLRELEEKLIVYPLRVGDDSVGPDVHTWELLAQRLAREGCTPPRQPSGEANARAVASLMEAALRAASLVDATEAARWFPAWKPQTRSALATLIQAGRLRPASQEHPFLLVWQQR